MRAASSNCRLAHDWFLCNCGFRLPQVLCIYSASFKLISASFAEKSLVKFTLLPILFRHMAAYLSSHILACQPLRAPLADKLNSIQNSHFFCLLSKYIPIVELWLLQRILWNSMIFFAIHSWFCCQSSKHRVVIRVKSIKARGPLSIKGCASNNVQCTISLKLLKICVYIVQCHFSLLECGWFTDANFQYQLICSFYWRLSHIDLKT